MLTIKDKNLFARLGLEVAQKISSGPWHWFAYHFRQGPGHPFTSSIIEACADCERAVPNLGRQLLFDLAAISGKEKDLLHWDMLNQKLAEILALRQLFSLPWPSADVRFSHEPAENKKGKRPELVVEVDGTSYVFEVKAPAILGHSIERGSNATQVPGRVFGREMLDAIAKQGPLTLPRDNPVKDFLLSADAKFAPFKTRDSNCRTILIIVWDDHIYEPITSLTSVAAQGLLTSNSFAKAEDGNILAFPNVDAVILLRHLLYFIRAAREEPLVEREHAMDFGDDWALPNVLIPVPGAPQIPEFIATGLRAVKHDDPALLSAAEYNPPDIIFWTDGKAK